MCRKLSKSFFPLFLYASNNLVHTLLQLGSFHAHYTNHKNKENVLLALYEVYKETAVRITEGEC